MGYKSTKHGKKSVQIREISKVETSTGEEIKNTKTEVTGWEQEPPYVKMYLHDIGRLKDLNNSEQKLMNEIVLNMGYRNIVPGYKAVKEMMCEKLNMKYETLDKGIKNLYKKGILIRKARGLYVVDPNLFGRGSWSDVKNLRMVIHYHEDGTKSINTEISKQLNLFID
jgi:hypothetical protein